MSTRQIWVPLKFWSDHADRCPCDNGEAGMCKEVREARNRVLIEGTPEQIETLRSDAEFYAGDSVDDCPSIQRSARLTLAAIAKELA